jgi:hypothetical protein
MCEKTTTNTAKPRKPSKTGMLFLALNRLENLYQNIETKFNLISKKKIKTKIINKSFLLFTCYQNLKIQV